MEMINGGRRRRRRRQKTNRYRGKPLIPSTSHYCTTIANERLVDIAAELECARVPNTRIRSNKCKMRALKSAKKRGFSREREREREKEKKRSAKKVKQDRLFVLRPLHVSVRDEFALVTPKVSDRARVSLARRKKLMTLPLLALI